jgi:predicted ATPase/DNA-binding CsgD family transcriptional regulator
MHSGAIIGVGPGGQRGSEGPMRGVMTVDAELFGDALPTYFTRFIGRERECAELAGLLRSPGVVTVCGVGGAGKTRLAVQVVRQLRADSDLRVCWVPLATTLDSAGVVPAVAHGLGLSGIGGGQLAAALGSERAVLVLDNCEHVAAGCRTLLGQLVADCVDLRVITTSRVPLGLSCERIYGVPALGSATDEGGEPTDAMALFVDRAAGVASGYALTELNRPVLAEICRTLQGSPLAIELAASWIRVLSPRDVLTSLARAGPMVGSDSADFVEERHRSIEAVLDSSWRWLGETDRAVIEALGVFVGGFTREAAEAVAGADLGTLSRLSQLALIQRLPDPYGGSRYQVHEIVRNHALNRLELSSQARRRHLGYFLDRVESRAAGHTVPIEPGWHDPLAADLANIDAALAWALDREDAESAQRLAVGLEYYWLFCIHPSEHRVARLEAALALPSVPGSAGAAHARAKALLTLGRLEYVTNPALSRSCFREAMRLFQQVGDAAGVANCILCRGVVRLLQGDPRGCRQDGLDSLARSRACGDEQGAAWALQGIGEAAIIAGDLSEAAARLSESIASFAARDSPLGACYSEIDLALAHQLRGEWVESVDACSRALDYLLRHRLLATSGDLLEVVARQCVELSRWTSAAQLYGAAASWHSEHDQVAWYPIYSRFRLADVARRQLGEPAWLEAYESGRALAPDHATRLAGEQLSELSSHLGVSSARLSLRETEVLRLVAAGFTDLEIAEQLVLSPRTIHAHLRSIYRKMGVGSRTAAVVAAADLVMPPASR